MGVPSGKTADWVESRHGLLVPRSLQQKSRRAAMTKAFVFRGYGRHPGGQLRLHFWIMPSRTRSRSSASSHRFGSQ